MSDPFRQILNRADAAIPAPKIDVDHLPGQVRNHAIRQRRIRTTMAALFVALGSTSVLLIWNANRTARAPVAQLSKLTETETTPASLESEIQLHEQIIALLESHQRIRKPAAPTSTADPFLFQLQQDRNRAALILLNQGDRNFARFNDRPAAEESYRLAIRLFPGSPAAATASQRIEQMPKLPRNES